MTTRCTRCLLPDTYPGITFDDAGRLQSLSRVREARTARRGALLAEDSLQAGREYDCVARHQRRQGQLYVAYLAKRKYGLRALAVCYDFTFMVDLARQNIRAVCDSLGLELLVMKSSNNLEHDLHAQPPDLARRDGHHMGPVPVLPLRHQGDSLRDRPKQGDPVRSQRRHQQRGVVGSGQPDQLPGEAARRTSRSPTRRASASIRARPT